MHLILFLVLLGLGVFMGALAFYVNTQFASITGFIFLILGLLLLAGYVDQESYTAEFENITVVGADTFINTSTTTVYEPYDDFTADAFGMVFMLFGAGLILLTLAPNIFNRKDEYAKPYKGERYV